MASRSLAKAPRSITVCGERVVLVRSGGRVYGLHDRCPHRGVPLSAGRCKFSGTVTCAYHGWTYDLQSGELVAALTDGPDSPIVGRASVRVKTYPVEERVGLLWVYIGDEPPPPVEDDIPDELLRPDAVIIPLIEQRAGNWRYAVENGIDEAHAKYLHRATPWTMWSFSQVPAWSRGLRMLPSEDGRWLMRVRGEVLYQDDYPGIGRWPRHPFWKRPPRTAAGPGRRSVGARMPGIVRVAHDGWSDYEMFVPVDADHHLAVLLAAGWARETDVMLFRLRYWLYIRWVYYGLLNRGQDQWMVELMNIPPERLYRPDLSVTAWRQWCQRSARGA
jgi:phenylpropionate dioxygenase-like ring-hydroxylating dioxygenase large terminal subunit